MKKIFVVILLAAIVIPFISCSKDGDDVLDEPMLIVKFKFDPTQARLNNLDSHQQLPPEMPHNLQFSIAFLLIISSWHQMRIRN